MARRTRRLWTDEEKRSIYLQTTAPGVSVAQVALHYTVNANLIFIWLRDPKYRPSSGTGPEEAGLRFLPVKILRESPVTRSTPVAENHIEIDLAGGHRMRLSGSLIPRLWRGLSGGFRLDSGSSQHAGLAGGKRH